jgi:hypothetical protein
MKHLSPGRIALHAGGDLPLLESLRARFHLRRCARCREDLHAIASVREDLARKAATLPADLDWQRLESEMRANIHLGLTVSAIAESAFGLAADPEAEAAPAPELKPARPAVSRMNWSLSSPWLPGAAVLGSLTLVVLLVWLLSYPPLSRAPGQIADAPPLAPVMTALESGLEVRHTGGALTLLPPPAEHATLAVDLGGSARAEYVDVETGQVTIHRVFHADDE